MSEETQEIVGAEAGEQAAPKKPARTTRARKTKAADETQENTPSTSEAVASDKNKDKPAPKKRTTRKKTEVSSEEGAPSSDSASVVPAEEKPKRTTRKRATAKTDETVQSPENTPAEQPSTPVTDDEPAVGETRKAEKAEAEKLDKSEKTERSEKAEKAEKTEKTEERESRESSRPRQNQNRSSHNKHERRDKRDKRNQRNNRRDPIVPQTTREDLEKLKVTELRTKADELGVEHKGLLKAALIDAVLEAAVKAEGFISVEGVLDVLADGYGFLRTRGYLPSEDDVYVGAALIRRNGLRKGDIIAGSTRPSRSNEKYSALQKIDSVNGVPLEELGRRPRFADMTPIFPDQPLIMEHGAQTITARVIDLCAPIGKGQRGLIVSPPKAGKTTILKDIAASIAANNPEVHLMCLLVDERPEEVTDMERSIKGEVMASTFDMPSENHVQLAEMVIERAKRLVENGEDVVILLDSITRLARAYNLVQPASGRILSGGVDSTALYPPKKFLGAARNIENGGSLTILASALIETGSKMDEVIFEEFKGTGNMEVKLDRQLADRRIFPAIDPVASGTRREDLLINEQEAPLIWAVRRVLANRNNTERAMEMLIRSLRQTHDNQEFLMRAAKKMQGRQADEQIEL
ncbi:MAG: transcription termination factor Rho [Eggerthellaceae bacterium]|nr:transcription termination factor Rho [Eggerthellaceae bacterium]